MDGSRRRRRHPARTVENDSMRVRWYGAWRSARFIRRQRGTPLPDLDVLRRYLGY